MKTDRGAEAIFLRLILGTFFVVALVIAATVIQGIVYVGAGRVLVGAGIGAIAAVLVYASGSILFAMLTRDDR